MRLEGKRKAPSGAGFSRELYLKPLDPDAYLGAPPQNRLGSAQLEARIHGESANVILIHSGLCKIHGFVLLKLAFARGYDVT